MTLGEKMSSLRRSKGLTQDDVAEKLGVTPQAVSKWENDVSCPDIMLLSSIAEMYGVTTDELLSRKDTPITFVVPSEHRKPLDEMILRITVTSNEADIKLNLPLAIARSVLKSGVGIVNDMEGVDLSQVDWEQIFELAERGLVGRFVEIHTKAEDTTVIVEVV